MMYMDAMAVWDEFWGFSQRWTAGILGVRMPGRPLLHLAAAAPPPRPAAPCRHACRTPPGQVGATDIEELTWRMAVGGERFRNDPLVSDEVGR